MNNPSIAALVLLATMSGLTGCSRSSANGSEPAGQAANPPSPTPVAAPAGAVPDKVLIYYFHGTRRCRTCLGIQETIAKTIRERFSAETASGVLAFREVNIEEPWNRHFVKTFSLSFSTMVVAANKGETTLKWENCNKVWDHAHDAPALTAYTTASVRKYLALLEKKK